MTRPPTFEKVLMIRSLLLGAIQGLTEFLPVSSSGHLVIVQELFGFKGPATLFDALLHFGTLLAVFIVLRERISKLILGGLKGRKRDLKLFGLLALASVPIGLAGFLAEPLIESAFESLRTAGIGLLVTGVVLLITYFHPEPKKDIEKLGPVDAASVGLVQVLALIPGISRSGVTISAGRWRKMEGSSAAEFSFLLMIPAVLGATGLELSKLFGASEALKLDPAIFLTGTLTSCLTGILAIKWLLKLLERGEFNLFGLYCLGTGGFVLFYSFL